MRMKVIVVPVDASRNAFRRPNRSIKNTDSTEHVANSVPPHAEIRCDVPGARSKDGPRIWLA